MKKNKTITLAAIGIAIVTAVIISQFVDWRVDSDNASGDIAKSSHFSRNTADENVGNMKELLQNDEEFKNGVMSAYMVMKTRAEQFNALVDMSAEVAGDIQEFEPVLKEMKAVKPMVKNVCESMKTAAKDLNAALGNEEAGELEQNTSNAALAYNTLQKQNKLASQFIKVADDYQKKAKANDRLKFVRDQWVDYQLLTAALTKDEQLAQELGKKGYSLSENMRAKALASFDATNQAAIINNSILEQVFNFNTALSNSTINQALKANPDLGVLFSLSENTALNDNIKEATLNNTNVNEATLNNTNVNEATLNANPALRAHEIGVQTLMSYGMGDLANLRNSIQDAMMSLVNNNNLGQTVQMNDFLGNQINTVINNLSKAELNNHQNVEL